MKHLFVFISLIFVSTVSLSQQNSDKIILVCKGSESGYKVDVQTGVKTEFNILKTKTYQISNGRYRNRVCKISDKSIWCREEGEGPVMGDSYLIRYYDMVIDRYSGSIKDYVNEIMTHQGIKTETVNTFNGVCEKVIDKKF